MDYLNLEKIFLIGEYAHLEIICLSLVVYIFRRNIILVKVSKKPSQDL